MISPLLADFCQDIHYQLKVAYFQMDSHHTGQPEACSFEQRAPLHVQVSFPLEKCLTSMSTLGPGISSQSDPPSELALAPQANSTSTSPVGTVLASASHVVITGGSFVTSQTNTSPDTSISTYIHLHVYYYILTSSLLKTSGRYSTEKWHQKNAILNSGGRAHPVACYPGTREDVMDDIDIWVQANWMSLSKLMWLSGPAGSGKSSIVQSYAEHCIQHNVFSANFFFFRPDSTRNHGRSLAATLLYQIIDFHPQLKSIIGAIIAEKPLLLKGSLRDQFASLILHPVGDVHQSSTYSENPIVLLIDGLDECSTTGKQEQQVIIEILDALVSHRESPFIALVASRPKPHLTMAFNNLSSNVKSVFLDERYGASADIRYYVTQELAKIKNSHHLAHTLDTKWPSPARINEIVDKSSGQFLYADIAIRFVSTSPASPELSLESVLRLRPVKRDSPFSELDAMYAYIL